MTEITDYITNDYQAFDNRHRIADVKDFFAQASFTHFPVLEERVYIGSISMDDAETFDDDENINHYRYSLEGFYARTNMIWLDVLEVFAHNNTNVVPVLDDTNEYVGYYEISDIIKLLNETPFIQEPGGVLVVEKQKNDYSIGQAVQIVESNNGKVLGIFIAATTADTVRITIKVALGSMNEIIQSFRRYNYEVISEHQEDNYLNNLKDRSDYLDKYLNI